mgnify:CR=1 FL=1
MDREEYNEEFSNIEFSISEVNQYALDVEVCGKRVRVPVRDSIAGDVAYLPRDESFAVKKEVKNVLKFDSNYLPVSTPFASVDDEQDEEDDNLVTVSYDR